MADAPPPATLIIMTKAPARGQVKTRLAKSIGDKNAFEVYLRLLVFVRKIATEMTGRSWKVVWAIANDPDQIWAQTFVPDTHFHVPQSDGDLGEKMYTAFEQEFLSHSEKIIMIGCDCPELNASYLEEACARLREEDLVLGPAADGGYILIGLSRPCPGLFSGPEWGSGDVLEKTLKKARENQISYALLPTCSDLDTARELALFPDFDPRKGAN